MRSKILAAIALIALSLGAPYSIYADDSNETVTIQKSQLTDAQKAQLATNQQVNKWAGMGDEIGKAINSSLSAISNQANNFAQTPVGKWTVFVVIYKVIGKDIVGYIIGACMAIGILPFWIWSYRKFLPKKYVTNVEYAADGKTKVSESFDYGFSSSRNGLDESTANGWLIGHWALMALWWICIFFTMFGSTGS